MHGATNFRPPRAPPRNPRSSEHVWTRIEFSKSIPARPNKFERCPAPVSREKFYRELSDGVQTIIFVLKGWKSESVRTLRWLETVCISIIDQNICVWPLFENLMMFNESYRFDSFEQVEGGRLKNAVRWPLWVIAEEWSSRESSVDESRRSIIVSTLLFLADENRHSLWYTYNPQKKV